jgi:formiminotetrahydrofolate cyclodeaminase
VTSSPESFLDQPVRGFLDQVAARTPAPGGGVAAAVTGAMAAGLVAMAARFSTTRMPGASDLADQADELRLMAAQLADMDARAYTNVLDVFRRRGDADQGWEAQRREALLAAAKVPLEIAEIGARVAALAVRVAEDGNPNLCGDAVTGALLGAASARSAAGLVDINVRLGGLDPEVSERATRAAAEASAAADQVMTVSSRIHLRRGALRGGSVGGGVAAGDYGG